MVDLALLIGGGGLDKVRLLDALQRTFTRRDSHDLPLGLIPPPPDWRQPFEALAKECGLPADIDATFNVVNQYFRELLVGVSESR